MANKPTKAQLEQRVRIVYELLLSDTPRIDIVQYVSKTWGGSDRTADNYIRKANDLIIAEANEMRVNALENHLAQRAMLRNKALKDGDLRLALEILRDEAKLLDLYSPLKVNAISQNLNANLSDLTDEQLKRLVAGEDLASILSD